MKPSASCYYIGLSLTIPCYSSPFGATNTTAMKKPDGTSKSTGLLSLPRELLDQIYEDMFYVDEFQIQHFQARPNLDPSILSVNKKFHDEASEFLYEKNHWVTAKATDAMINSMYYNGNKSISGFPGHRQPFSRYENDPLSDSAILHMDLRRDSDSGTARIDLVIPLAAMPRFCRHLTAASWVNETDVVLHFNSNTKESLQSRLLCYLGQARGLRSVDIVNPEPTWASLNTALLMTHPYKELGEILNTMSAYQESSEKEMRHGRTLAARNIVQDGVDFVDWWSDRLRRRSHSYAVTSLDKLFQTRADMGFSSAWLSLQLGDVKLAQKAIYKVLERLSRNSRLSIGHKARAHYHMGKTFEALGWVNAALYSYLQALRLSPGYSHADAAVDDIEESLGSGTALEDARVEHNINHVLSRFRYKSTHGTTIRVQDYDMIFRKFEGTAAEIRSVDRYSRRDVSSLYRKTPGVLLTTYRRTWCI